MTFPRCPMLKLHKNTLYYVYNHRKYDEKYFHLEPQIVIFE